jgi:hypothetical protein
MKKIIFLISIFLIILNNGCDSNYPILPPMTNYPFALNQEWEYENISKIELYDSFGNIDNSVPPTINILHSLVKVIDVNVNLESYNNIFILEDFLLEENQYRGKNWYLYSDSGLYNIAYDALGVSQFLVIPKVGKGQYLTFSEAKEIVNFLKKDIVPTSVQNDSIYFYEKPRKVYNYPLKINDKWVELNTPFYREKTVIGLEQIEINNNLYNCFVIESISPELEGIELYDYVNPAIGLIQKKIIVDSIKITTIDDPDNGELTKITDISRLIRKNF